jgi:hypothetical protein
MKFIHRVVIFGLLGALTHGLTASFAASVEDPRIYRRSIPSRFEREVHFFEMLKWPKEPTGVFDARQTPSWNVNELFAYLPMDGIEFADVNHRLEGHVNRARIMQELTLRKGKVFVAFAHLSSIYTIPYKQYSELHFSQPATDTTVIEMARWYKLSFKRVGENAVITRWEYVQLEDE